MDEPAPSPALRTGSPRQPGTAAPARPRDRATAAALLGLAALASLWGNVSAWTALPEVNAARNPVAAAMLAAGSAGALLLPLALARLRRSAPGAGALVRWSFCGGVLLWCGYVAVAGAYYRARCGCAVAGWAALVAALCVWLPARPARPRPLALLLLGVCLALPLGELLLRLAAAVRPSPLSVRASAGSAQRLRAYAFAPGEQHLGFSCNDHGFYDGPFLPRAARTRPAVAVIGDSFSASYVPHACHYTTVCERELGDVDLWNVGWPAIGPAEYRLLLVGDVLPLDPDAVVVSLFLGNDLAETRPASAVDRWLADWFDRGNVLLCELPRRLLLLARGGAREAGRHAPDPAGALAWLHDPSQEPGTFAAAEYLRIETDRARVYGAIEPGRFAALLHELRRLRAAAGRRPFGLVLIPDEAMVEDALWRRVEAAAGVHLDRQALRRLLVDWCANEGIACLDLWPALAAVPPLADGDRHLYLLRDTHWNARGNEAAGRALAPFVRALLRR